MANSFLSSLLFFALVSAAASASASALILPIHKDPKTSQHLATFQMGSRRSPITAAVDLGGPFLWFACNDYSSATYSPIPCDTPKCAAANGSGCVSCISTPPRPGCTNNTCLSTLYNPFLDIVVSDGFGEDTFFPKSGPALPEYSFSCIDKDYTAGLAGPATGMLGLARSQISLHKQASKKLNLIDTFSLCLPSSSAAGKLTVGIRSEIAKSFKSTPLIVNPVSTYPISTAGEASEEYFIGVKSIYVGGVKLDVKDSYFAFDKNGVGGTKISTSQNLTAVHSSIYKPLARAFAKAASDLGIRRVAAAAPFGACFNSDSIARAVPEIDLILAGKSKSGNVTWRMRGANLMVEVDRKTTCLGIVDGGSEPRTAVVIGAHQLEENLLEFDLVKSQLRFSESLLFLNTSCSKI